MITLDNINTIGIIGAGTMGQGIAQVTALAGYKTLLYDIDDAALSNATKAIENRFDRGIEKGRITREQKVAALKLISTTAEHSSVKADLIIEAIVEKLEVKHEVLKALEMVNSKETILASNTSSIPITRIGSQLANPERLIGIHFFNPAPIMRLVEVISGAATSAEVAAVTKEFVGTLDKVAVLANDSPGFIVNRVARHFYGEGLKILEENIADVETIDSLMRASGFKMGPFQLMDLIGVDTNLSVTQSMFKAFYQDPKFRPSRIQQQKVDAGYHGRKSGRGFYDYEI